MGKFILQRVAQGVIVVIGVVLVVFVVTRLVGDPVSLMLPLEATPEERAAFEATLGLDQPLLVQLGDFAAGAVRLDFGDSLWQGRAAFEIIAEALPKTFILVLAALSVAVVVAIPVGIYASLKPGSWIDRTLVGGSLLGLSIPQFWLGLMLILFFGVKLGWFPTSGYGSWKHIVLPAVTLALPAIGRLVMMVRSTMIDELHAPYVETSQAKGMPRWRTVFMHAFRNASIPVATLVGWEFIRAMAGYAVVVETVFAWPGIGFMSIQAINQQDLILLQAIVFVVAIIVVAINIGMDFLYMGIDPRIKVNS
ncbi:MAG: ABC transporter permease [Armatimonadetes bacterium]|nr:MAG: ABC transporter permease [Armatimonadota bacterium]